MTQDAAPQDTGALVDVGSPDDVGIPPSDAAVDSRSTDGGTSTVRPTMAVAADMFDDLGTVLTLDGILVDVAGLRSGDVVAQFPVGEIVLVSDSAMAAEEMAERWNGEVTDTIDFGIEGTPKFFTLRVDATMAPVDMYEALIDESGMEIGSHNDFSSDAALGTFMIVLLESVRNDLNVSPNFLMNMDATPEEIDLARGIPFVGDLSYLAAGGVHDIGVTDAWQLLAAKDRIRNKVRIMVMDGGFLNNGQLPTRRRIAGTWGAENGVLCSSGSECPWHATNVVASAMGAADSLVPGPAGPVAELFAVSNEGVMDALLDLWDRETLANLLSKRKSLQTLVRYISSVTNGPLADRPNVINLSFSAPIPAVGMVFAQATTDIVGLLARQAGIVVVASAGNSSTDVDEEECTAFGALCWETTGILPCEMEGVLCVGSLNQNSATLDTSYSSFGTRRENASTVEIYSTPGIGYSIAADGTFTGTRVVTGTSFSSPFVAGVAALVKAANPGLSAQEVVDCLLSSAHDDGRVVSGDGYQRRVNALGAVKCALGDAMVANLRILSPANGTVLPPGGGVTLNAIAVDDDGTPEIVSWFDGAVPLGTAISSLRVVLGVGPHTLRAVSANAEQSVRVVVSNVAPEVRLLHPMPETRYYADERPRFLGYARDLPALTAADVCWEFDRPAACDRVRLLDNPTGSSTWFSDRPISSFPAGLVDYSMVANDGALEGRASANFIVLPEDPRNRPPVVAINPIAGGVRLGVDTTMVPFSTDEGGENGSYEFSARAVDVEDGALDGSAMFWTLRRWNSTGVTSAEVLCDGGERDCSSFRADNIHNLGGTSYGIVSVEVIDSVGAIRQAHVWLGPRIAE